ncbi:MAG: cytochrome c biogenesis protein CcdA [Anaerolineae bacterium]|nr:cytochrome c biogenesis protein CcdA [Anaerolineae bacterium]
MDKLNNPMLNLDLEQEKVKSSKAAMLIGVPAILVVGLLFVLISYRGNVENAVASFAALLPVGYAFAAGMVASVNPCGVMMLPTYILYHVGNTERKDDVQTKVVGRLFKGVLTSLAVTGGFVVVFGVVGGIITLGGQWLRSVFPYAGLLIGIVMLAVGVWMMLSHRTFGFMAAGRLRLNPKHSLGNMMSFGVVYAVGSLSCTLPIFLVVVGSAIASGDPAVSIGQFLGYALGMGSVIFLVTQAAVLFQFTLTRWLHKFSALVHRFNALFMVGAGGYLIVYWIFIAGLR